MRNPLRLVATYLETRDGFYWLNMAMFLIGVFLVVPLVREQTYHPFSWQRWLIVLVMALAPGGFLVAASLKGSGFNRLLFITVVSAFVLVEIIFGAFWGDRRESDDLTYPHPYIVHGAKPLGGRTIPNQMDPEGESEIELRVNEWGFNEDKQLRKDKADGEIRVCVLGGSTVFMGSTRANTIPALVEKHFHKVGLERVAVYNFGVISFISEQELSLLVHTVVDYEPDLVIVYDGGNDVYIPFSYDPRPGYPHNFITYEERYLRGFGESASFASSLATLLDKSHLINRIFRPSILSYRVPIEEIREEVGYRSERWEVSVVEKYIENIEKMCKVAEAFEFTFALILQPLLHFKTPLVGNENNERVTGGREFTEYTRRQYERIRMSMDNLRAEYSDDSRFLFSDLSLAFENYPRETFWDFIHVDDEGNRFVTQEICERLKPVMEKLAGKALD